MKKRTHLVWLLLIAAQFAAKSQMTIGGSYKPSHTLVVKGQVKIDTVQAGSLSDSLLTIGADSVIHRIHISRIADGSQTRLTAGTNTTITGTGTGASPYVINAIFPATTNTLGSINGTLTSTVNGISATAPVLVGSSNGITASGGNVALGGTLNAATTITGGTNKLSIASVATDGFAVDGSTFSVDAANHRVGIGTNAPATSLDVRGTAAGNAIRIADGTQSADKVLVSDANGNGRWNAIPGNMMAVTGNLSSTASSFPVLADNYTGSTITLPPGKWAVSMILLIKLNLLLGNPLPSGYAKWVRTTLTNSETSSTASADIVGSTNLCSGSMTGPNNYGLVNGILVVNNAGTANKTYYLWIKSGEAFGLLTGSDNLANFGTSLWSEDQIIAIPIR